MIMRSKIKLFFIFQICIIFGDEINNQELALNHFMQGEFLMNQGNYALAILEFQDAIELVESGSTKDYDTGQRTRPSRPIPTVDRTERLGEDRELMDRFRAEEQVRRTGEEASEGIIEELIDKRKKKRSELADELSDLDDLIDSD